MGKLALLKDKLDFAGFRNSKSFHSASFWIRVRFSSPNQNTTRFGFIIPKKLVPKAVHRNLIRRRIKSILLKLAPDLRPVDILFFSRPRLQMKKFADLEQEIKIIFGKAHLWKP